MKRESLGAGPPVQRAVVYEMGLYIRAMEKGRTVQKSNLENDALSVFEKDYVGFLYYTTCNNQI